MENIYTDESPEYEVFQKKLGGMISGYSAIERLSNFIEPEEIAGKPSMKRGHISIELVCGGIVTINQDCTSAVYIK